MAAPSKTAGWVERLHSFLDERVKAAYDPVSNNCATLVIGAIAAMCEISAEEVLKRADVVMPDTEFGVNRLLAENGGVRGFAERFFDRSANEAKLLARRGDIVVMDGITGETLGVVVSGGVIAISPSGLATFDMSEIKGFWSLP